MFPSQFSKRRPAPSVAETNSEYLGWNVNVDRLFFANGQRDPWRYATVSSPLTNRTSTAQNPITIGDGFHASDLFTANAAVDASIAAQQAEALKTFAAWLQEWTPSAKNVTKKASTGPRTMSGDGRLSAAQQKQVSSWNRKTVPKLSGGGV
jgi:hypothetical protein